MSDPQIALVLIPTFLAALAAASWFKTLDTAIWRQGRVPLLAGLATGLALRYTASLPISVEVACALLLTAAALYVRLTGRESEPSDGMLLGAVTGAAAASLFVLRDDALARFSQCSLAGAVSGYGITFGISHIRDRWRQFVFDGGTAMLAIAASMLATTLSSRFADREVAIASATLVPLLAVATVFRQWPVVADELRGESEHGLIEPHDVRTTSHPFLRLARGGWHSFGAHREFVRIATRVALRKRQQRTRPEPVARLYQLEVIKLRMEMQEMIRVDRAMRAATVNANAAPELTLNDEEG